jgi:hypothetical protein
VIDIRRHNVSKRAINAGAGSDRVDRLIEIETAEIEPEEIYPRTCARRAIVSHSP